MVPFFNPAANAVRLSDNWRPKRELLHGPRVTLNNLFNFRKVTEALDLVSEYAERRLIL